METKEGKVFALSPCKKTISINYHMCYFLLCNDKILFIWRKILVSSISLFPQWLEEKTCSHLCNITITFMKIWNRKNRKLAWIFDSLHLHSVSLIEVCMSNLMGEQRLGICTETVVDTETLGIGRNLEVQITNRLHCSAALTTSSLHVLSKDFYQTFCPHYNILNLLFEAFSPTRCTPCPHASRKQQTSWAISWVDPVFSGGQVHALFLDYHV